MSGEHREPYHRRHGRHREHFSFLGADDLSPAFPQNLQGLDLQAVPSPFMSFTDYLHGSTEDYGVLAHAFDLSGSQFVSACDEPRELVVGGDHRDDGKDDAPIAGRGGDGTAPVTPNSSMSSSSMEAAGEDDSAPGCKMDRLKQEVGEEKLQAKGGEEEEGVDKFKKVNINKPRKKGEKRQREPQFAFMTRSEVDHLEDGYRWRKYGQKAVKNNSQFPRSYYRCTAQRCNVKKRVERSYQDPAVVITTYEGQHTHHSTADRRADGAHYLSSAPSPTTMLTSATSFRPNLLLHQAISPVSNSNYQMEAYSTNPSMCHLPSLPPPLPQLQVPDYGLILQDGQVPSSFIHSSQ